MLFFALRVREKKCLMGGGKRAAIDGRTTEVRADVG